MPNTNITSSVLFFWGNHDGDRYDVGHFYIVDFLPLHDVQITTIACFFLLNGTGFRLNSRPKSLYFRFGMTLAHAVPTG